METAPPMPLAAALLPPPPPSSSYPRPPPPSSYPRPPPPPSSSSPRPPPLPPPPPSSAAAAAKVTPPRPAAKAPPKPATPKQTKRKRNDSEYSSPGPGRPKKGKKGRKGKKGATGKETTPDRPKRKYTRRKEKAVKEEPWVGVLETEDSEPRHCYGPQCLEPAREGSKYCSDECGMKLATARLFEVLPKRIQQWQASPCQSEARNKAALEEIRQQQLDAKQTLLSLDQKAQRLDALLTRAKTANAAPVTESQEEGEDTELCMVYCVTCGHEVSQRSAVKHMEKCFAKFESLTSYGSIYKSRIEGNSMFCDAYNAQSMTYCKRLKVLCPEHSKEPKVGAEEICGSPLTTAVFRETGEFCQLGKRRCNKHVGWEKLRRANIDMERLRQWMKLDELFEQERSLRAAMASRAGVLGLMLHQTIDHDPLNPVLPTRTAPEAGLSGSLVY